MANETAWKRSTHYLSKLPVITGGKWNGLREIEAVPEQNKITSRGGLNSLEIRQKVPEQYAVNSRGE